jgi:hypothetical protein
MTQKTTFNQPRQRPSFADLMSIEAVRTVSCWRLPNTDGKNDESVAFAEDHGEGLIRLARKAVALIVAKAE